MTLKKQTAMMEAFNAEAPVGTPVLYWTGLREGQGKMSRTRSTASLMSDHAVVWVEGQAACIALTHVQIVKAETARQPLEQTP